MTHRIRSLLAAGPLAVFLGSLPACGPGDRTGDGVPADGATGGGDATLQPPGDDAVWAHSSRQLYRVDPGSLQPTLVGSIVFSDGINQLTDLAVDASGGMVGVSTRQLYRIDKTSAAATLITELTQPYNGLSYVDDGSGERLLGTTQTGELWRIDATTGQATRVGEFGGGLLSSGDIVFVYGAGLLATVTRGDWTTDRLARIDPLTGAATVIGDTGYDNLFGIGYWGGRVVAFGDGGALVSVDTTTGAATLVSQGSVAWWGAAVTTTAPIIL